MTTAKHEVEREALAQAKRFAELHLRELATDILDWHAIGLLRNGRMQELANLLLPLDSSRHFQIAEDLVKHAALARASHEDKGWMDVRVHGLPPCDGETVYVGENEAGYMGCFNGMADPDHCLMQTPEGCDVVMSGLRFWRVQDRPAAPSSHDGEDQ